MSTGLLLGTLDHVLYLIHDTDAYQEEMISLIQPPLQQLPKEHNTCSKKPG